MIELKVPTIAVVVLTLNEEQNLQRCLDSIRWADQVLLLDSGSQDKTLEIARQNHVSTLIHSMQPFIISEQRNYALDVGELKTEWVLFIDADEVVTESLHQTLIKTLSSAPESVLAYCLAPKFMFLGRWLRYCQGYPSWHDRLIRRGRVRFKGGVWESFDFRDEPNVQVEYINEPYLHFSVNKGIDDWFIKHLRYAEVEARDILHTLGQEAETATPSQHTERKRLLRDLSANLWPVRPFARFVYMYLVRCGFLDGIAGLIFCLMMTAYEFLIVFKVIELQRRANGLSI